MRASIAIFAAVAGLAAAAPQYGYGESPVTPEYPSSVVEIIPSSSAPAAEYPMETPSAVVPEYPAETPETPEETSVYVPEVPTTTPVAPEHPAETTCESSVTITITVPYPSGSAPASSSAADASSSKAPEVPVYPSSSVSAPVETPLYPTGAPYPSGPVGTGVPPVGTASSTGSYPTPTSTFPPEFTGAASHAKVGGFIAGVGAFAAFFL